MAQAAPVEGLGPIDRIVVELHRSPFRGDTAPHLADLVDREMPLAARHMAASSGVGPAPWLVQRPPWPPLPWAWGQATR